MDATKDMSHDAAAQSRPLFTINIDGRDLTIHDPIVSGRQVLEAAGKRPADEFIVYFLDRGHVLQDLGLERTVDLQIRLGDHRSAMRQIRAFRQRLKDDMGLASSPLAGRLVDRVRSASDPRFERHREFEDLELKVRGELERAARLIERIGSISVVDRWTRT